MNYRVHGTLQARILEWVGFPFSKGSTRPRDQTQVSCIAGRFLTSWAIGNIYIYIPSLLDLPPTPLCHHRTQSWAPCAIQQLPTSYLFNTWWCIYVSPNLAICPTLLPPSLRPQVLSLHLCLYSCPANSKPTTGHIPWENHNSKRHMYPSAHGSSIYNSQDMEAT